MAFRTTLTIAVLLAGASVALAVGVTEYLDDFGNGVETRRTEVSADLDSPDKSVAKAAKKKVKQLEWILKTLSKPKTSKSYAKEIGAASAIAKKFVVKLQDELDLRSELETAMDFYFADVLAARAAVLTTANDKSLDTKTRKRARKRLDKGDRQIAKIGRVDSLYLRLRYLSKAANVFEPDQETGPVPQSGVATWVVRELGLAPAGIGPDLDDDGDPDNALGSAAIALGLLGIDLNDMVRNAIKSADEFLMLRMWNIDSWENDPSVDCGIAVAIDGDGDPDNNFGGQGVFTVPDDLDTDGQPVLRAPTSLMTAGGFELSLTGSEISIGDIDLGDGTVIRLRGVARSQANSGALGFALPLSTALDLLEANGVTISAAVRSALETVMDVDLDGDGETDALSTALSYTAVPATLTND